MDGSILIRNEELMKKAAKEIRDALNAAEIPDHLKVSRVIALSKRKGSEIATLNETRTIAIGSHYLKIMEKAIS